MQIVGAASCLNRRRRRPRRLEMDGRCYLPVAVALDHAASYSALLDGQGCLSMMAPRCGDGSAYFIGRLPLCGDTLAANVWPQLLSPG